MPSWVNRKASWKQEMAYFIYHLHFKLTYRAIWIGHSEAFEAGGYNYQRYRRLMHYKFNLAMDFLEKGLNEKLSPVYIEK